MEKQNLKQRLHSLFRSRGFLMGMLLVGLLILIYPLISNQYYKIVQGNYATQYEKTIQGMDPEEVEEILQQAHTFNENLYTIGGSPLFSGEKFDYLEKTLEEKTYPTYFNNHQLIGTVEVPKIKCSIPIFVGVTDDILEKSCGFMLPSSLPVGGPSTHAVLTAHRGLPQSRLFRDLGELKEKDLFFVKILGDTLAYEADEINIIVPTDFSKLGITQDADEVTLLTCHPYTINSHRLLVKGHRVEYTEEIEEVAQEQQKRHALKLFYQQYKEYFYGILIFLLLVGLTSLREKRKRNRED